MDAAYAILFTACPIEPNGVTRVLFSILKRHEGISQLTDVRNNYVGISMLLWWQPKWPQAMRSVSISGRCINGATENRSTTVHFTHKKSASSIRVHDLLKVPEWQKWALKTTSLTLRLSLIKKILFTNICLRNKHTLNSYFSSKSQGMYSYYQNGYITQRIAAWLSCLRIWCYKKI